MMPYQMHRIVDVFGVDQRDNPPQQEKAQGADNGPTSDQIFRDNQREENAEYDLHFFFNTFQM